jgi:hypothetical protein
VVDAEQQAALVLLVRGTSLGHLQPTSGIATVVGMMYNVQHGGKPSQRCRRQHWPLLPAGMEERHLLRSTGQHQVQSAVSWLQLQLRRRTTVE